MQIIRTIGAGPFQVWPHPISAGRPRALAKQFGVSVDTVERRMGSMEKSGLFRGREIWPNLRHLGRRASTYHLRLLDAGRKSKVVAELLRIEGMLDVFEMVGADVCVDMSYHDDAELNARLHELRRIAGVVPLAFFDFPFPAVAKPLTPLDWRIIEGLRGRADRSLDALAKDLKVSGRTVKRRFDAMLKRGDVDIAGNLDLSRLRGHLLAYFLFTLKHEVSKSEAGSLLNAFRSRWVAQFTPPDPHLAHAVIVTMADSASEVEEIRREGESLPIVARTEALLFHAGHADTAWLDKEIADRAHPETERSSAFMEATARRR